VELFEEIRRGYEFGVGTIAGVARKVKVHRRMVREAIASALPKPRKKTGAAPAYFIRQMGFGKRGGGSGFWYYVFWQLVSCWLPLGCEFGRTTALELLLKAGLAIEDRKHLVAGKAQVSDRQFDEGDFHSIRIEDCLLLERPR